MKHLIHAARIVLATLREIFDEAPYARFLLRTRMHDSREAYRAFWREREHSQARKPKCC